MNDLIIGSMLGLIVSWIVLHETWHYFNRKK